MLLNVYTGSALHAEHKNVLAAFACGAERNGIQVQMVDDEYTDADMHVIFGSWKERLDTHHKIKKSVVSQSQNFICIETALVGRQEVKEISDDRYYRVGINGFLADTANFCNKNADDDRWLKIAKDLDLHVKDYRENGDYIIVALQLPGDASLRGLKIEQWVSVVCDELRRQTDRPIIIRKPQLERVFDERTLLRTKKKYKDIRIESGSKANLMPMLSKAWCTVTYTSGFGVDSYIAGVPSFALDTGSFVYELGNTQLCDVEAPALPCRKHWLSKICYAQWSVEEMAEGDCWQNIAAYI